MSELSNQDQKPCDLASTLCRCWRIVRRDHVVLGFTDHDCPLVFEGIHFSARTGLECGDYDREVGFSDSAGEVSGILDSEALKAADIQAGLYDDARVETWRVNWMNTDECTLLDVGLMGPITHNDRSFHAEIRSLMCRLDESRGRLYESKCSANLGDPKTCGVHLDTPTFSVWGTVTKTDGRWSFSCHISDSYPAGWFTQGHCTWVEGENRTYTGSIQDHTVLSNGNHNFKLWNSSIALISIGDRIHLYAGCDKNFYTCQNKFRNIINFRGFPHIPGHDFLIHNAQIAGIKHNGKSIFKQ